MKKKDIIDAYVRIRTIDHTIPDDVLDFMKDSAISMLAAPPSSPTATAEEQEIILKFLDWYDGDLGVLKDHNGLVNDYFSERNPLK